MLRAALEQLLISIELEKIIMIDVAQNLMSLGESIAAAHTASVNDNMIRSHYHDYYELYFLDNGERYHYIDDKLYKTEAGDCIIFPPQTMHRSYSEQGCTFSRIVLYFRPDIISSDALRQKLADSYCVYKSDTERGVNINTVALGIVFCKYCSHRIKSPYHSINHLLQKSEAFQSVHHVVFILCYTVLEDFLFLVFSLIRVHKSIWEDIT